MISFEQSTIFIIALYAFASLGGLLGIVLRQRWLRILAVALVVGGFALQTFDMARGSHGINPDGLSWGTYLQIFAWFMVLCGFFGQWKWKSTFPVIIVTPLALMIFLLSARLLYTQIILPPSLSAYFFALHIGSIYLSLALMVLACASAIVFLYMEKMIKTKTALVGFRQDFPALTILDKINEITTYIGFPLFSVGILAGFIWANSAWGSTMSGDPKEIISLFIWALFAWLFHMRAIQGRKGRKPAILVLCLFGLSFFSMLFVNTFMDTHHSFIEQ